MEVCSVRRGYQLGVDREKETGARKSNSGCKNEARACAVEKVPDGWVCESEGETELER